MKLSPDTRGSCDGPSGPHFVSQIIITISVLVLLLCHWPLCRSPMKPCLIQTSGTSSASGRHKKCSNCLAVPAGVKERVVRKTEKTRWPTLELMLHHFSPVICSFCTAALSKVYQLQSLEESVAMNFDILFFLLCLNVSVWPLTDWNGVCSWVL